MATTRTLKTKKGKLEVEVERLRAEGNWNKALEIIGPLISDRSGSPHYLNQLILCEKELEIAETGEPSDRKFTRAIEHVREALKTNDEQYKVEASVLYAKILFLQEDFKNAFDVVANLNLPSMRVEPITLPFARIVSEGIAILGLCKEKFLQQTRTSVPLKEGDNVCSLYELSARICLRHLQELDRGSIEHTVMVMMPILVRKAIQCIPVLSYRNEDVNSAICKYRSLLRYTETPSTKPLRQALARQFGELLLRGVSNAIYRKWEPSHDQVPLKSEELHPMPHRYPVNRFIPENRLQEAILMLLISEHIASQDVILNRPSETSEVQILRSFNNTVAVYDLLSIALLKVGHFDFLSRTLEKALKFSYREFHIWFQFALSLIGAQKYYRAYLVLRECLRIDSNKICVYMLASSLCLGHLGLIEEGMELASQGRDVAAMQKEITLCARSHLMLGWGWSLLARSCRVIDKKVDLQNRAVSEYRTATKLDPEDYLAWYHLGVELATQRHLDEALSACQQSLQLMPIHSNTLCLLALLHTAGGKRLDQASKALLVGLTDRPTDFNLLFLLAKVEAARKGPKAGLRIYRRLLEVWRDTFAPSSSSNTLFDRVPESTLTNLDSSMVYSSEDGNMIGSGLVTPSFELDDESSLLAVDLDENPLESALSQIALGFVGQTGASIAPTPSSNSNNAINQGRSLSVKIQMKIYRGLAELYLENGQLFEAKEALDEAVKIGGLDHGTLYLRGSLAEKQGLLSQARSLYESVIALKPTHLQSLLSLADLLHRNGQETLAERVVRDAMNIDPAHFHVWRLLAEILKSPNAPEPASETVITRALLTAIELEQTEPLEPFYHLPLGVRCS